MTTRYQSGLFAALLAVTVLGGAVTPAAAATAPSLTATPAEPGATATHAATITVGSAATGSLNGFQFAYGSADASGVGQADVVNVGIDRGDDAAGTTVDVNVSDDLSGVSVSDGGKTVKLTFGGSYSLEAGDEVVVVIDGVRNPGSAGTYEVELDVNPQSSGGVAKASLDVSTAAGGETTTTESSGETTTTESSGEATTQSGDATSESGGETTTTEASAPGFGAATGALAALATLAGAAFVARRD